jgi:hypothetical protein
MSGATRAAQSTQGMNLQKFRSDFFRLFLSVSGVNLDTFERLYYLQNLDWCPIVVQEAPIF